MKKSFINQPISGSNFGTLTCFVCYLPNAKLLKELFLFYNKKV